MSRIAYVNGRYVAHRDARVHVEDRGYQFSDGVYEVIAVQGGQLVDEIPHLRRLERSLAEIRLPMPMTLSALRLVIRQLVLKNRIADRGLVYLQISRGVAPRNHVFPSAVRPSLVMTARALPPFDIDEASRGVRVVTMVDLRWRRCDIKSVSLLANVLAKQSARDRDAYEAWLVDEEGMVTEGASSNAWIVTDDGELVTRNPSSAILNGITRCAVIQCAEEHGIAISERPFSVDEARRAQEAFLTSTSSLVKPVVRIDETVISGGRIGTLTKRALDLYVAGIAAPATD